jgi:hypothetical protein
MRALGLVLLAVIVLLVGAAAAIWWFPGPLLAAALRAGGVQAVSFEDLRLGATTLEVEGLRIGAPPGQGATRLVLRYRLGDLLQGRLASIEIEGLELHGRLVDGRLELAGLPAAGDGGEASLPALPWPERILLRAAEIRLATPWGELLAPLTGALSPAGGAAAFRLEMSGGELINDAGRLQADLTVAGSAPLDPASALRDAVAHGRLALAAAGFGLPGLAGGIDGGGEVAFELAAGRLDARLPTGALRVAELGPALAPLAAPLPPPWRIELGGPARPLRVSGTVTGDRPALELDGALRLLAGPATLEVDLAAQLAGEQDRLSALGGRASVAASGLRWPAATLDQASLELVGQATPDAFEGTLDLALAGGARPMPAVALEGVALRHRLALSFADRQLVVRAAEAGRLALERLGWAGKGAAGPLAFTLPAQAEPLLTASLAPAGGLVWQQRLQAAGESFEVATAGPAPLQGRAQLTELTLALDGDQDGLRAGRLALAGGRLQLPAQHLALEGIASELALAPAGIAPDQAIPFTIATISHGGTPAWFAPLALHGTLRPGTDALAFDASLERPGGALKLMLRGRHALASGRGEARVELGQLVFAPGKLQPGALAPVSAGLLEDVAGTLALDGTIGWGAGPEVTADLALLLEDLAFTAGPARFSEVNGVVTFDRLWPLTTPPGQLLAIGLLDLGLPLTSGQVAFQRLPDGALAVERLRWDLAGGTVGAAPFRVGSVASDIILSLSAEGLDLARLLALTRLDGLSGEGTIGGTLPVRISGAEAVIEGGELKSAGPGWLRYRSDAVPAALQAGGANVSLLLQALENFRYEALRITLDGRTDAEMDIGLHVKGANPDLYGGHPIELNLDLEGELANILRSGLASYQIPDRIREQMQGFRRR